MRISPSIPRPSRPRLTGRIFLYGLVDAFGLTCVSLGIAWFVAGKSTLLHDFPSSAAEAVASLAGGAAVMFWAVVRIMREMAKQTAVADDAQPPQQDDADQVKTPNGPTDGSPG